jgi:hypothetical protein
MLVHLSNMAKALKSYCGVRYTAPLSALRQGDWDADA